MKQKAIYFILPILLVAGYFLVASVLPKYTGQYFAFVVLLFADIYLWAAVRKMVFNYRVSLSVLLTVIYWLPLIGLIGFMAGASAVRLVDWNPVFMTYLLGFIFVFYTAKLLPIIFIMLSDLIDLTERIFKLAKKEKRQSLDQTGKRGITRRKFMSYMGYLSGGLLLGTMLTGMFKWVYQFNLVREKIKLPNLPASFNGLKIVQLSDMHLGSWAAEKPLVEAVKKVNELEPDLILFTGDLVNYATSEAFRFEKVLNELKAKKGIFVTLGNHDYGDYMNWNSVAEKKQNMRDLYKFYRRLGWTMLNNENRVLKNEDGALALLGVENWGDNPRFQKYGDIDKAFNGTDEASVRILMSHDPSHWEKVIVPKNYPVDLTLSGHTHGFQFGIEIPGIKWSPAKWLYKYWAGLYRDKNSGRSLYVNRGLGAIGYPGRIGILPEITEIVLSS